MSNNSFDNARSDIVLGIESHIVHKYVIDNAPDIQSIINLYKTCEYIKPQAQNYLFGFLHTISHAMVNPSVIDEISDVALQYYGDYKNIFDYVQKNEVRQRWNTPLFHQEMKAVAGNYKACGGFMENNIYDGIAHHVFNDQENIFRASSIIENWLNKDVADEDDLIKEIYRLSMPGLNVDLGDYWLLHFCRGVSLIRQKVCGKQTNQSVLFLDMIGVKLFREKYNDLQLHHMPSLYNFCKMYVVDKTDAIFTYGDFGCLCCEMHRLIDEFKKNGVSDFRQMITEVLNDQSRKNEWFSYKENIIKTSKFAPSVENSARSNVGIFINFCRRRQREYDL